MLFKLENAMEIIKDGFTAYLYNQKPQYPALNAVFVECYKGHERVYVKNSHRLYFVLEGSGIFEINGAEHQVAAHDVVVIEPNVEYSYKGKMKLFEVNFPATDERDEVVVDR